jgi:hypothetical protein
MACASAHITSLKLNLFRVNCYPINDSSDQVRMSWPRSEPRGASEGVYTNGQDVLPGDELRFLILLAGLI